MSEDEVTVRRLRAVRPDVSAPARETAASVLPSLPRVGALDALLRQVDGLRLTLETDLSLAASAVESGAPKVAVDIIDSDLASLRRFESSALDHLAELSAADLAFDRELDEERVSWWRRVPATPFVAAASVVAFLLLAVPHSGGAPTQVLAGNVSASERLEQISHLARTGQTSEIRDAAAVLHGQLLQLVEQAKTDPQAAQRGLQLLSDERSIIALSGDSLALGDVLADSTTLSNLIISRLPAAIRPRVPAVRTITVAQPTTAPTTKPQASSKPTTKPSSKPSTKPSASASASASSKSTSQPSPTPSSTAPGGVLPSNPKLG